MLFARFTLMNSLSQVSVLFLQIAQAVVFRNVDSVHLAIACEALEREKRTQVCEMLCKVFLRENLRLWEIGLRALVGTWKLDGVTHWNDVLFVVLVLNYSCAIVTFKLHLVQLIPSKEWYTNCLCVVTIASWTIWRFRQPFLDAVKTIPFLASVALLWLIDYHQAYRTDEVVFKLFLILWRVYTICPVLICT